MGKVHQVEPAARLHRGDAGVHQDIGHAGAKARRHHRNREHPDHAGLTGQHEPSAHQERGHRQRHTAKGHPSGGRNQHGHHSGHRGHEHEKTHLRLVHPEHQLEVGQGGGKGAP